MVQKIEGDSENPSYLLQKESYLYQLSYDSLLSCNKEILEIMDLHFTVIMLMVGSSSIYRNT